MAATQVETVGLDTAGDKGRQALQAQVSGAAEGAGPSDSRVTADPEEAEGEGCGSQNCLGSK